MAQPTQVRVGGYRIIRKLAVGGMAEIFLAQLEAGHGFTKTVVIKRMLPQLCEDRSYVEMFMHEARLAAHLNHPNVAQVFDIGESEGRPHYAMEYVHGPDLRAIGKRMHASGSGPRLDLVLGVGIGAAAGLHHAHTALDEHKRPLAVVHRDVTPSNVVVTYSGVPKLLDFGVAKASLDGRESTAVGVLKGKLPYMSPEQIDTSVHLDARSDVFSLGVVLWELTTLCRLYRYPSQVEVIRRITGEDAPPPSSVVPDYPPRLEEILMWALARDRDQRCPDALTLQRELELFAAESGIVVSGSRIADHMSELFAIELAAERDQGDDAPTRVRSGTPGASSSLPGISTVAPPTGSSVSGPSHVSAAFSSSLPTVLESDTNSHVPASRRAQLALVVAVSASLLALLSAFGLGRYLNEAPAERPPAPAPSVSTPAPEAPHPAAVGDPPRPAAELAPESAPEPAPEVVPEEAPEPAPSSSRRARKKSKTKQNKTPDRSDPESDWNKNSLSMPE